MLAIENIGGFARGHDFLLPARLSTPGRTAIGGRSVLNLASKNYLGLLDHPAIQSRIDPALRSPDQPVGRDEQRWMRAALRSRLEGALGQFLQKPAAYAMDYSTLENTAAPIQCLFTEADYVIQDEESSTVSRLSGTKDSSHQTFRHNDIVHLESVLKDQRQKKGFVILDALYIRTGELAPIPQIASLCKRYGALLAVDESHSFGVIGATGRGIQEHFELGENDIDIKFGSVSNALPSACYFVASAQSTVRQIRDCNAAQNAHRDPNLSEFSAAIAGLEILMEEPTRVSQLQDNAGEFQTGIRLMGFQVRRMVSPVVTIALRSSEEAASVAETCLKRGLFVASETTSPGVPKSCIQLHLSAIHSRQDIKFAMRVFNSVAQELGYKISFA